MNIAIKVSDGDGASRAILRYCTTVYGAEGSNVTKSVSELLASLRAACRDVESPEVIKVNSARYIVYISMLESIIPCSRISGGSSLGQEAPWVGPLDLSWSQSCKPRARDVGTRIEFETLCTLFNLGAGMTHLADREAGKGTIDSRKSAIGLYQYSGGVFGLLIEYIKDVDFTTVCRGPCPDFSSAVLEFYRAMAVAQAHAAFFEGASKDGKTSSSLLAKLAAQTASYYESLVQLSSASNLDASGICVSEYVDRSYCARSKFLQLVYQGVSHYHQALHERTICSKDLTGFGLLVARLKRALSLLKFAVDFALENKIESSKASEWIPKVTTEHDAVLYDNTNVYMEVIPSSADLVSIQPVVGVVPPCSSVSLEDVTSLVESDQSAAGAAFRENLKMARNTLENLVPVSVRRIVEGLSPTVDGVCYQLDSQMRGLEKMESELRDRIEGAMAGMGVRFAPLEEAAKRSDKGSDADSKAKEIRTCIPQKLLTAISNAQSVGGPKGLADRMSRVEAKANMCVKQIGSIANDLKVEAKEDEFTRRTFGQAFNRVPSGVAASEFHAVIHELTAKLNIAIESNAIVRKRIESHKDSWAVLNKPISEICSSVDHLREMPDPASDAVAKTLRASILHSFEKVIARLDEASELLASWNGKRANFKIENDWSEAKCTAYVSANGSPADVRAFIASKRKEIESLGDQFCKTAFTEMSNLAAQSEKDLAQCLAAAKQAALKLAAHTSKAPSVNAHADELKRVQIVMAKLTTVVSSFRETSDELAQGSAFFSKLLAHIARLTSRVSDFVNARNEERARLVLAIQKQAGLKIGHK